MYSVEILPDVAEQVAALPAEALVAFAEANVVLELTPWAGDPLNREHPERNMRSMTFGVHGVGLMVYVILEDQRRVFPLKVMWAG